jgi:hypothetical protein
VELLYLRARYYQPEVGRFITKDPWEGDLLSPATLNLYVYTRNNPLNLVDPSGLQICGSFLCQPQVVDPDPELRRLAEGLQADFRIIVGTGWHPEVYEPYYVLWSRWSKDQLKLVRQAAIDFATHMQGGPAHFRRKVGPVPLYKREGELVIPFVGRVGGWTFFTSVTLPGTGWTDEGGARMKGIIVHELAHFWDVGFGNEGGRLSSEMSSGFWTSELADCQVRREERGSAVPIVTVRDWREGRTRQWLNPDEDWADSVFAYVYHEYADQKDAEISEGRWYFVGAQMNPGNPDRFPYPEQWESIDFDDIPLARITRPEEDEGHE